MCDTFLQVAEKQFPELLPQVRADIARAMTGWLVSHGIRAEVQWSAYEESFFGYLLHTGEDLTRFSARTPTELQAAFEQEVNNYIAAGAEKVNASE